jgi:Branched-chain amino acid transport system / permease component
MEVFTINVADYTILTAVKNLPKGIHSGNRYLSTFPKTEANAKWAAEYRAKFNEFPINCSWENATGANVLEGLKNLLAGLAGALAAPVRSIVSSMGLSVVVESFIVTVIGGMGSVAGALIGSLLIGLVRSFGTIGFPLFTEGLMFLLMAVVLVLKPSGLFGREG